jgi:hypothetical protein
VCAQRGEKRVVVVVARVGCQPAAHAHHGLRTISDRPRRATAGSLAAAGSARWPRAPVRRRPAIDATRVSARSVATIARRLVPGMSRGLRRDSAKPTRSALHIRGFPA